MVGSTNETARHARTWRSDAGGDYAAVAARLPVVEESVVPIERGDPRPCASIAATDTVAILRAQVAVRSVGVTVLDPAHFAFVVSAPANGTCWVNGCEGGPASVWLPDLEGDFYIRGGARDMLGVSVVRSRLIDVLSALQGVGPEDISLASGGMLELPPGRVRGIWNRIVALLETASRCAAEDWSEALVGIVADTYLRYLPERADPGRSQSDSVIVRRAEERFERAEGGAVSVADLCAASGVGKTTLYRAFHSLCGQPPLSYFQNRRLTKARSLLFRAPAERGSVKRCALEAGFKEMGRFSSDYRRVFGELPSATLERSAD